MTDWESIKEKYLSTDVTYRELAEEFHISMGTLSKRAGKESWGKLKRTGRADNRVNRVAEKLLQKMEEALDQTENMDSKEIKTMTDALRELKEMNRQENHILPLCEMLGCGSEEELAVYNDGKKHITFPNGSRILFRYCDNDKDVLRFQGTEVDVLFVDEATQQSEARMEKLKACVRGVNDYPKRIYYTCNPGGEGHGWVKRLFIDRNFKDCEDAEEHSFIQALVSCDRAA